MNIWNQVAHVSLILSTTMPSQTINVAAGLKAACDPAFLIYQIRLFNKNELQIFLDDFLQSSILKNAKLSFQNLQLPDSFAGFPDLSKEPVSLEQDVWKGQSFTTQPPDCQHDQKWMQAQSSLQLNDLQHSKWFTMSQHWAGIGYSKFHKYARVQIPTGYELEKAGAFQVPGLHSLMQRWPNCVFARSQWHAVADVQSGIHYMKPDKVLSHVGIQTQQALVVYEFAYAHRVNKNETWICNLVFIPNPICPSMILIQPHPLNRTMSQLSMIDFSDFWKDQQREAFDPMNAEQVMCIITPDTRKKLTSRESKRMKLGSSAAAATDSVDVQEFVDSILADEITGGESICSDVNCRKRRSRQLLFDQQHYALHAHAYYMPELEKVFYGNQVAQSVPMSHASVQHVFQATFVDKHCTLSNPSRCIVYVSHPHPQRPRQQLRMVLSGVDLCNMYVLVQQGPLQMLVSAEEAERQLLLDIKHTQSMNVEIRCRWNEDHLIGLDQDDTSHVTIVLFNSKHVCFGAWTLLPRPTEA